jgi:cobalt-precorrin-5B (C1)-methyltransferase
MSPQSGYTLPVFACAAAIAGLHWLRGPQAISSVSVDLQEPPETVAIPIEQVAGLPSGGALAITRSDPGQNLDLTRHTPIWAWVEWGPPEQETALVLQGGEGVGTYLNDSAQPQAAIYGYAQRLFQANLAPGLQLGEKLRVTILLPEGRWLAERTSNAAFGVVEGLSLLGTSGISQPLSAPEQLEIFRKQLRQAAQQAQTLVFCVGENGLDLARQLGIPLALQVKTANWIGPLLVEAGLLGVEAILLLGYHGKLIKLAGGIFHTHHHLADARQEILTAAAVRAGLPLPHLQMLLESRTVEAALGQLRALDQTLGNAWVEAVYTTITEQIDRRSQAYIFSHTAAQTRVGSCLFNRDRHIFALSSTGSTLLEQVRLA